MVATLLIVALVAGAGAGYYVGSSNGSNTKTVTTTCSGYPPAGDCITPYSTTFNLRVNYTGPWKVTYQGYNSGGRNISGGYSGAGFNSTMITLTGLSNGFLTLCAQAQKLDSSGDLLILTITGYNETSMPYGVVSYCGGTVP